MNYGKSIDPVNGGFPNSLAWPVALWQNTPGWTDRLHMIAPQYCIDPQDTGRLHVAAALFPDIKDDRIFGFSERYNWDKVLDIMRKAEPNRKLPDNLQSGVYLHEIKPRARAEQILREMGEPGFVTLEQSMTELIEQLRWLEREHPGKLASRGF